MAAGWAFQGWHLSGWHGAGWHLQGGEAAEVVPDISDGFRAVDRTRTTTAEKRGRAAFAVNRTRTWFAPERNHRGN